MVKSITGAEHDDEDPSAQREERARSNDRMVLRCLIGATKVALTFEEPETVPVSPSVERTLRAILDLAEAELDRVKRGT
jgi:hypothetical protein